jgi:nuclear transport factor 2 (NTF2) superfamily protein
MTVRRPPLPSFTEQTAREKVKKAQDAWNTRAPELAAHGYTIASD